MPPKKPKGKTKHVEDKVEKKVEEKKVEKKEEPPSAPPVIAPEHEAEPTKPQETIVHESGAAGGDDGQSMWSNQKDSLTFSSRII